MKTSLQGEPAEARPTSSARVRAPEHGHDQNQLDNAPVCETQNPQVRTEEPHSPRRDSDCPGEALRGTECLGESAPGIGTLDDRKNQPTAHTPPSGVSETNNREAPVPTGVVGEALRDSDCLGESAPGIGTLNDRKSSIHTPPSGDSATPPSGASETDNREAPVPTGVVGEALRDSDCLGESAPGTGTLPR